MKVCIFAFTGSWGGMDIHTVNLSRELVSEGHDVELVEIGKGIYEKSMEAVGGGIKFTRYETGSSNLWIGVLNFLFILLSHRGEVLLLPKGSIETGDWKMDLLARLLFKKYISIEHLRCEPMPKKESKLYLQGLIPGLGLWWYMLYLHRYLRGVGPHKVICVSDSVCRGLADLYAFPRRKLKTILNGIDTDTFKPSLERRNAIRASWGIPEDSLVFGSIGRLSPEKGFGDSIRLFKELVDSAPHRDVRYVIVGEGTQRNRDNLQSLINGYQLSDKIFLYDFTDRPWEIYPSLDVFLMPSRNEGLPLALLEAMASGCCPIAMGVGGIPEVLVDRSVGWLVSPGDFSGFALAMIEAARSTPEDLQRIGKSAREHVVASFNAKSQYPKMVQFINDQLQSKEPSLRRYFSLRPIETGE